MRCRRIKEVFGLSIWKNGIPLTEMGMMGRAGVGGMTRRCPVTQPTTSVR